MSLSQCASMIQRELIYSLQLYCFNFAILKHTLCSRVAHWIFAKGCNKIIACNIVVLPEQQYILLIVDSGNEMKYSFSIITTILHISIVDLTILQLQINIVQIEKASESVTKSLILIFLTRRWYISFSISMNVY